MRRLAVVLIAALLVALVPISPASAAYERYVTSVDNFIDLSPAGKSNLRHNIYIIWDDGNISYDFWANKHSHNFVPGRVLNGSDWYTYRGRSRAKYCNNSIILDYGHKNTIYGPTTNQYTVGFSVPVGKSGSGVSFQYSRSTAVPYLRTVDESDISAERTSWWLEFDGDYKWSSFTFDPSTNLRVPQNGRLHWVSHSYVAFNHWFYPIREQTQEVCMWVDKPQ